MHVLPPNPQLREQALGFFERACVQLGLDRGVQGVEEL